MPRINSFADALRDWESLLAALNSTPDLLPVLDVERRALEHALDDARDLKAQQEAQTADRQELTQQIKEVVAQGKGLAITIRAVARGKIGYRNERLVLFKVAPVRPRRLRPAEVTPPPEAQPLADASGAPEAPAAEAHKPES